MKSINKVFIFIIIVCIFIHIFAFYNYTRRYFDYDSDYVYYENDTKTVNPEGTKVIMGDIEVSNVFGYEGSDRIEFTIDKDIAKEIGQAVHLSTVRRLLEFENKHIRNEEIANNYTYNVKEIDHTFDNISISAFRITCISRRIFNLQYSERLNEFLGKYGYEKEIEIIIDKENGGILNFKVNDNDAEYYIDERCALDIASAIFKRKFMFPASELYEKAAMRDVYSNKEYICDTYGIVNLANGTANTGDEEQEYYEVMRKPRFSEMNNPEEGTFKLFKALIRKNDGKIEKIWLTEGVV